ncbi:MAG: magnetochrome domain-containing protein [Candidatus Anammoxibacter sp.]
MDRSKFNLSDNIRKIVVAGIIGVVGIAAIVVTFVPGGSDVSGPAVSEPGLSTGFVNNKQKITEAHWQGMEVMALTWELAAKLGIPIDEKGVIVDEVTLAAGESGLRGGDIIKSINGVTVTNLAEFYNVTKRLRNQKVASINVKRGNRDLTIELVAADILGFAQVESAPMILPGSIAPHRYRGACTGCHAIGNSWHITPDPELVTLTPPPISVKANCPHRYRGKCKACHVIK